MPDQNSKETIPGDIATRIEHVGQYSRFAKIGFAVILFSFLLTVVGVLPANLESVPAAIDTVVQPLIFVGLGFLLFAIAMHLHLLHLNLVRQIEMSERNQEHEEDNE